MATHRTSDILGAVGCGGTDALWLCSPLASTCLPLRTFYATGTSLLARQAALPENERLAFPQSASLSQCLMCLGSARLPHLPEVWAPQRGHILSAHCGSLFDRTAYTGVLPFRNCPPPPWQFPGVPLQINYLCSNPCHRVCYWGSPA